MSNEKNSGKKKGLSNALKYFFGVGDAGFVLMSNIETFYFMTFLTDIAAFSAGIAGLINSVFTIVDACLSWLYGGIINGTKAKKWGRYRSWLIMIPSYHSYMRSCLSVSAIMKCCPQLSSLQQPLLLM